MEFRVRFSYRVKDASRTGLLIPRPALILVNALADKSHVISVPREKRVHPTTPEKLNIGLNPLLEFAAKPIPAVTPT